MSCDVFSQSESIKLLGGRSVWLFGDSNTRSIYKDLVWLLEYGSLVPQPSLQTKNEPSHANDCRTSNSPLTSGRHYEEIREYCGQNTHVKFTFITKLHSRNLLEAFAEDSPDVLVINSCVWDLTRWGPDGVAEYKRNVVDTMQFFKRTLPGETLVIFATTLPLSSHCTGGFLKKQIEFLRYMLPWHITEANSFLEEMAKLYRYDVLDFHYNMRFLTEEWMPDGIHWTPIAYRFLTNLLLTHLALSFNSPLPGVHKLDEDFILASQWRQEEQVINNNNRGSRKRKCKIVHCAAAGSDNNLTSEITVTKRLHTNDYDGDKNLDFSRDEFTFTSFIESFSPQLTPHI